LTFRCPAASLRLVPTPLASIALFLALTAASLAADAYKWSVQYLIDNSEAVEGRSQMKFPRRNRGLALSPDGKYLYAGYHHSWNGQGEVRKIAVDVPDYQMATERVLPGPLGKAIATDDKGRVYIADVHGLLIYDADLEEEQHRVHVTNCEGVAVVRENGKLLLYTSDRARSTVERWVLTEEGKRVTDATPAGFDGTGIFHVTAARSLRGLKVDARGNIWVCDYEGGRVFRIRKDGKDMNWVEVKTPMDLAFDGKRIFVTRGIERAISVIDDEMVVAGSLNVPWEELELSLYGNNRTGSLSGIVTVPGKGFYVANEGGQTGNQRSTYGTADDLAEIIEGKVFRDATNDDNEPILKATAVITTAAK
jgi:sugar lactone lactonase YvrE